MACSHTNAARSELVGFGHETLSFTPPPGAVRLEPPKCERPALDASTVAAELTRAGLWDGLSGARRIALVVNDQTRKGGMRVALDAIAALLAQVGTSPRVDLVIAYGLHARQPDDVSRAIYGNDILGRANVVHHDARSDAGLASVGRLPDGQPLSIAREVAEADLRVLVGGIGFHYYAGFSGGRKAILPGVADEASIVRNHLRMLDLLGPGGRAAGCAPARLDGNPVSHEMFAGLRLLDSTGGATFLANARIGLSATTPNGVRRDSEVVDLACGWDHEAAFRSGCDRLVADNAVSIDPGAPFDGVIASAGGWPYDASLYQAHKAYDQAFRALAPASTAGSRPTLVFVARCSDGLGHPRFASWLEHPTRDVHYAALVSRYEIVGQTSLAVRDKAAVVRTVAVTDLEPAVCAKLGWEKADSLDDALRSAAPKGRWGVMPNAAQVLPIARSWG